ncbi:MAG TPA: amino acid ABC transporter permease, partial [Usitatibacter sp.]|nr:amino acid ABC transporter permease [Usitatibacter sp.]
MDFSILLQQAPSGGMTYLGWLGSGTLWTLLVSILAWIIAFTLGSILGVLRTTPLRIPRRIATAYVELFRNVPLLVQMFLWYFVMPEVIPKAWGDWIKTELPNLVELPFAQFSMWEFMAAVACLGLYTASRVAEQVRAGIQSLPVGQTNAGLAIGLTLPQVYRHVTMPMAYRIIVPPMTSEFLTIFKNSSTALTIGVLELTAQSRQISEYTFKTFEAFTAATLIYIVITLAVIYLMR